MRKAKLTAFEFSFAGLALGGRAVVLAPTEERAREILLKEIEARDEVDADPDDIDLAVTPPVPATEGVVYYDNGDY